jgi:hypothetical protein
VLIIKLGDVMPGVQLLRAGLDEFGEAGLGTGYITLRGILAEALGRAGQTGEGLAAIEEGFAWTDRTEERWAIAELLRVKGELLLLQCAQDAASEAENHFRQALDWARPHGGLASELRAATSLARLLRDQSRSADALALLQPVYGRFTEGSTQPTSKPQKHFSTPSNSGCRVEGARVAGAGVLTLRTPTGPIVFCRNGSVARLLRANPAVQSRSRHGR